MDTNRLVKSLAKQPLFKNTPENVLIKLASQVTPRSLTEGEILMHKNAPSNSLFIIRRGWLKVLGEELQGDEVILNHVGPGQIIGEMSVIDKKPRSNTVAALKTVEVLEIKYTTLLEIINEHPVLALSLLQEMSSRLRFANAYIEETIEWFRHIATGNYDFVKQQVEQTQSTIIGISQSDHARAGAFLSVFFKMIEGVKQREDHLKIQVRKLTIQIDEVKRGKSVRELTDTSFFTDLKDTAQKLRQERKDKKK